jgi:hypothetical protein
MAIVAPLPEHFQIPPSRIPGHVDHLFHSSGWENDVPHKILNGQWNVLMIKL